MAAKEAPFALGPPSLGLTISAPLGVGLWAWGDSATWGYGSYDSLSSEQSFKAAYQASLDAGECTPFCISRSKVLIIITQPMGTHSMTWSARAMIV